MMITIISTIIIFAIFLASFFWLNFGNPAENYLAVMLTLIVAYVVAKRVLSRTKKVWFRTNKTNKNTPHSNTTLTLIPELVLIGSVIFIVVGFFGGLNSVVWPLIYFYLFFLAFLTPASTTIIITVELMVLFYLLTPNFLTSNWSNIISLPIFLALLLLTKKQYSDLVKESSRLAEEKQKVAYYNFYAEKQQAGSLQTQDKTTENWTNVEGFWQNELMPQINELQKLSSTSQNQLIIQSQLTKLSLRLRQISKTFFGNEKTDKNTDKNDHKDNVIVKNRIQSPPKEN